MSNIDKRALREAAEKALSAGDGNWHTWREAGMNYPEIFTSSGHIVAKVNGSFAVVRSDFIAAANPATVLALLDELEAKDSTIATQQQEIRTLLNALEQATEKRNYDIPGHKRLIGWRASDYTDETSDPELAKNWAAAIGVLPIFEGDVNTKLSAAGIGKGE